MRSLEIFKDPMGSLRSLRSLRSHGILEIIRNSSYGSLRSSYEYSKAGFFLFQRPSRTHIRRERLRLTREIEQETKRNRRNRMRQKQRESRGPGIVKVLTLPTACLNKCLWQINPSHCHKLSKREGRQAGEAGKGGKRGRDRRRERKRRIAFFAFLRAPSSRKIAGLLRD